MTLVELDAKQFRDEFRKPDLRRKACERRGDLRIEQLRRQAARAIPEHFEILARAVQQPALSGSEQGVEQWLQIDIRQAIDASHDFVGGELDQAERRKVGGFANEFGIDRDDPCACDGLGETAQCACIVNQQVFGQGRLRASMMPTTSDIMPMCSRKPV